MMSTVTPSIQTPPPPSEKDEKKSAEAKQDAVVSHYWGIARPKITREDGSEWPWNCFMVSISHTENFIYLFIFFVFDYLIIM